MRIRVRGILGSDCRLAEEILLLDRPTIGMRDDNAHATRVFRPNFASIEDARLKKLLGVLHEINHKVGVDCE